jgi:Hom_end-associated Hint/Helicase conserved C-terminal domain
MAYEVPPNYKDTLRRKEFYELGFDPTHNFRFPSTEPDVLMGKFLRLGSHQLFVRNFLNPNTPYKRLLIKHQTGTGKCFGADTTIMMANGRPKVVQEIQVGDELMGDDDQPRIVTSLARGADIMYKVALSDGTSFTCNSDHILCLLLGPFSANMAPHYGLDEYNDTDKGHRWPNDDQWKKIDIPLSEYLANPIYGAKMYRLPVEFSGQGMLIEAWTIGYNATLAELGLNNGQIGPCGRLSDYIYSPKSSRAELLAGILDCFYDAALISFISRKDSYTIRIPLATNGPVSGQMGYIEALIALLRGLGMYVGRPNIETITEDNMVTCGPKEFTQSQYYCIWFHNTNKCNIICKNGPLCKVWTYDRPIVPLLFNFTITKVGQGEYYGFTLDGPNRRFLLADYLVSHNTIVALSCAQAFQEAFKKVYQSVWLNLPYKKPKAELDAMTPSIFVLGFTKKNIIRELIRYPEFGFITYQESEEVARLQRMANGGLAQDIKAAKEFYSKIKRRITTKIKGGFYKFYGYQEFVNRLFITSDVKLIDLENKAMEAEDGPTLEDLVAEAIANGLIKVNNSLLEQFENSLLVCDEVHNVYNSVMKNNYGVAIQYVLDHTKNMRAIFLSATPINNSPTEIVDVVNLLVDSDKKVRKREIFERGEIRPGQLEALRGLMEGKVSFLQDLNPKYFPIVTYVGVERPDIPYMKFVECPISEFQYSAYLATLGRVGATPDKPSIPIEDYSMNDVAFDVPNLSTGTSQSNEVRNGLAGASREWLDEKKIIVMKTRFGETYYGGEWLNKANIGRNSAKYLKMLEYIDDHFAKGMANKFGGGKIMIYHERVKMSGVLLLKEVLIANGFIDEFTQPVDGTRCAFCGATKAAHEASKGPNEGQNAPKGPNEGQVGGQHDYHPARFILVYASSANVESSILKFNAPDNAHGGQYKILLASRVLKEGYDIKDVRDYLILSFPVNVPSLIQVLGRCVRSRSHMNLPISERKINIALFLSTLGPIPGTSGSSRPGLMPEEYRYIIKMKEYQLIQAIEREMHRVAVDAPIHRHIIMPDDVMKQYFPSGADRPNEGQARPILGPLYFDSPYDLSRYKLDELNLATFNSYNFNHEEVKTITYVIKRLFLIQPVWTYEALLAAIRAPPFGLETNPALFDELNFVIALSNLVRPQRISKVGEEAEINEKSFIESLFDNETIYIYVRSGEKYNKARIEHIGQYYILFPVEEVGGQERTIKDIDIYMRDQKVAQPILINLSEGAKEKDKERILKAQLVKFRARFEALMAQERPKGALCILFRDLMMEFNSDLYISLLESAILATIGQQEPLPNSLGRIVQGGQFGLDKELRAYILGYFDAFGHLVRRDDLEEYKEINEKLEATAGHYVVGYLFKQFVKIWNGREWLSIPKTSIGIPRAYPENNKLVGFMEQWESGLKFKIRKPAEQQAARESEKGFQDIRFIEKGIVCATKNKVDLMQYCDILQIPIRDHKKINELYSKIYGPIELNIYNICRLIRNKLMDNEIIQVKEKNRVKWFYLWNEELPRLAQR